MAEEQSKFQRYEQKQKDRGYIKKHPWIPAEDSERFDRYVDRLRKAHAKKAVDRGVLAGG
jgi:hypothetical protein